MEPPNGPQLWKTQFPHFLNQTSQVLLKIHTPFIGLHFSSEMLPRSEKKNIKNESGAIIHQL